MRVLLISPNRVRFPYPVYPLGLDYVAGALAPNHDVRILDLCPLGDDDIEGAIERALREHSPGAIGISVRNIDNSDATRPREFVDDVASVVRFIRKSSGAPAVLGGAGFTLYPREILEATGADCGLVGEGERAGALFDAIASGRNPSGLSGVICRGEQAPSAVPLAAAHLGRRSLPPANPSLAWYLANSGILNLQTQRGCVFRCVFCTYPGIEGRCVRARPAEEVAREAVALQRAGARYLFLTDSVFNTSAEHCLEVAGAFRRAGLSIPWGAYFAPRSPPPGFYDRLAEAGCEHVEFGTEALSDAVLGRIRKSFRRAHVFEAHRAARAAGIHVAHFLILGGPGETEETLEETFREAEKLNDAVLFFFCGMRIYRGTELALMAIAEGQIAEDSDLLRPVFYRPHRLAPSELEQRLRARAAGNPSWVVGGGEERTHRILNQMYRRGRTGPLWENLVGA